MSQHNGYLRHVLFQSRRDDTARADRSGYLEHVLFRSHRDDLVRDIHQQKSVREARRASRPARSHLLSRWATLLAEVIPARLQAEIGPAGLPEVHPDGVRDQNDAPMARPRSSASF